MFRVRVPPPLLLLVAAAVVAKVLPGLPTPSVHVVERVLTVALVGILFDGGMHVGVARFRSVAGAVGSVAVLGTFLTAGAGAVLLHVCFGLSWFAALLVATAIAPTDPAVVFSVLGRREILGRSGPLLEGESGANDPVGIALMASLLAAGTISLHAAGRVGLEFGLQLVVGSLVGLLGGYLLLRFVDRVPVGWPWLEPVRTLVTAGLLYLLAVIAHGSGFLAVFVAGIVIGDAPVRHRVHIRRVHGGLASLGEIVAFVLLGLTVDLGLLTHRDVWLPGLVLVVVVAFAVRPVVVWLCLLRSDLPRRETAFVAFAGLKGAVPLLLGQLVVGHHVAGAGRLYGIVVVVVVFSVLVQGSLTLTVAEALRVPMRTDDSG